MRDDRGRTARRATAALAVGAGLVVGAAVVARGPLTEDDPTDGRQAAVTVEADDPRPRPTTVSAPAPSVPAAPAGTATTTPAVTLRLPVPAPLPTDAYAPTPPVTVGRILIPAIGLDADLHQGMTLTAIDRGPSHWPGTALPGELGNVVVAGHRTTWTRPFEGLDLLRPGDRVVYRTDRGEFAYAVTGTEIVSPADVRIGDQTAAYTSTLFACHPKGSDEFRIVVHLHLLDAEGRPVPPPSVSIPPVTVPRP